DPPILDGNVASEARQPAAVDDHAAADYAIETGHASSILPKREREPPHCHHDALNSHNETTTPPHRRARTRLNKTWNRPTGDPVARLSLRCAGLRRSRAIAGCRGLSRAGALSARLWAHALPVGGDAALGRAGCPWP